MSPSRNNRNWKVKDEHVEELADLCQGITLKNHDDDANVVSPTRSDSSFLDGNGIAAGVAPQRHYKNLTTPPQVVSPPKNDRRLSGDDDEDRHHHGNGQPFLLHHEQIDITKTKRRNDNEGRSGETLSTMLRLQKQQDTDPPTAAQDRSPRLIKAPLMPLDGNKLSVTEQTKNNGTGKTNAIGATKPSVKTLSMTATIPTTKPRRLDYPEFSVRNTAAKKEKQVRQQKEAEAKRFGGKPIVVFSIVAKATESVCNGTFKDVANMPCAYDVDRAISHKRAFFSNEKLFGYFEIPRKAEKEIPSTVSNINTFCVADSAYEVLSFHGNSLTRGDIRGRIGEWATFGKMKKTFEEHGLEPICYKQKIQSNKRLILLMQEDGIFVLETELSYGDASQPTNHMLVYRSKEQQLINNETGMPIIQWFGYLADDGTKLQRQANWIFERALFPAKYVTITGIYKVVKKN